MLEHAWTAVTNSQALSSEKSAFEREISLELQNHFKVLGQIINHEGATPSNNDVDCALVSKKKREYNLL